MMTETLDTSAVVARLGGPIEVGKGWWPLIVKLDADLAAIDTSYTVSLKEKYGALSYDADAHHVESDEAMDKFIDLIDAAEKESATICEACGQTPARIVVHQGWWRCRCYQCEP